MKPAGRTYLLALIGALSELAAFAVSSRYVNTLAHSWISADDPRFRFTLGTHWGVVNSFTAGMLLCGGIVFVLVTDRKGIRWGALSAILAGMIGGFTGVLAVDGSDIAGIALERKFGDIPFLPEAIWSLIVPAAYALVITLCIGVTVQRLRRAVYASIQAWIWSFLAAVAAQLIIAGLVQAGVIHMDAAMTTQEGTPADGGLALMQASIPMWCATATAVGFVLGAVFGRAENVYRSASLLQVLRKNEGKEWNLDHGVNRIGSAEGVEVLLRNTNGVAPVHAIIGHHRDGFSLSDQGFGVLLNGQPLQAPVLLNNGDTIGIGQAALVFSSKKSGRRIGYAAPAVSQVPVYFNPPLPLPYRLVDPFGNSFQLHQGSNVIGREPGCEVCIHWDNSISRRHAEVLLNGGSAQLRELGSSNGTKLNGRVVSDLAPLQPGDIIQFGNVVLSFQG